MLSPSQLDNEKASQHRRNPTSKKMCLKSEGDLTLCRHNHKHPPFHILYDLAVLVKKVDSVLEILESVYSEEDIHES